ncbi:unnamed protein product [Larinioides sclopetarius]|uniref:THAP-type domain-containing protein n=1 Tax=Larinioides sclopetarius TaxID=280406 RepID=A0AAV2BJV6_9ARAC
MKFRSGVRLCTLCESPGPVLFKIPSDENRQKKWFSALKWNVPPEKLKYVLYNARLCNRHFSESCFSSTLGRRLNKFACPQISDLPSSASEKLFTLPSSASACSEIDNMSDLPSPASSTHLSKSIQNPRALEILIHLLKNLALTAMDICK